MLPNSQPNATTKDRSYAKELMASVVVFLVALPLCMGVAIASGAPPALGLVTGIVGGLVVGTFAGQPLQVSGPAAGLAVMVWQIIQDYGLPALALAVLITGVIQLAAGVAKLGRWFRAVSPAVIQGMLAGIGVLIFASQFHVMVDDKPRGSNLTNLLSIPEAIYKAVLPLDGSVHHMAATVGMVTILSIVVWNRFRPMALKMVPGPLVGVALATLAVQLFGFPIAHVSVPDNLVSSFNWISVDSLALLKVPGFWAATVGLAVIASAETLLCATATDRMHEEVRTDYNKELRAQGLGNLVCGVTGALPVCGVIVRSSANIEAGARTRWSAVLHGAWILILVAAFPVVLAYVPTASLAAILVYTGWKLLGVDALKKLATKGRSEVAIWGVTVLMIVGTDLLIGVAAGFGAALLRLLITFARLEVEVSHQGKRYEVVLRGAATFMSLPKLAEAFEAIPDGSEVHVHLEELAYVDHACLEVVEDWQTRHRGHVVLEMHRLRKRNEADFVHATSRRAREPGDVEDPLSVEVPTPLAVAE